MDRKQVVFLEKVEEYLMQVGVYMPVVKELMNYLLHKVLSRKIVKNSEIITLLRDKIIEMMTARAKLFKIDEDKKPYVILLCGMNGSGKTTTIGKMVRLLRSFNWSVVVGACDTFRAVASEQLRVWTSKGKDDFMDNDFVFKEHNNETSTKIALKALKVAQENKKDVLIIDTAGRVQNNQDLMAELLKMKQKICSYVRGAPHDVVLIVDSNCGYSAMEQVKMYNDLIGITGIIATKMDISVSAGSILSVCHLFKIPIYGITNGEKEGDIKDLNPEEFADMLLQDINLIDINEE
ncbi:MAG: AAA family ATPase [Rickettsiales bacterium]|nr:AAA family ATPase [Rickettsiales bacterium]